MPKKRSTYEFAVMNGHLKAVQSAKAKGCPYGDANLYLMGYRIIGF